MLIDLLVRDVRLATSILGTRSRMIRFAEATSARIHLPMVRLDFRFRRLRMSSTARTNPIPIGLADVNYRLFLQRQIWQNAAT
jgi:hypothetical protein